MTNKRIRLHLIYQKSPSDIYYTIILSMAMVMSSMVVSCSSNNEEDLNNKSIIGDWRSVTSQGYDIVLISGERINFDERPYNNLYMNFYEDGTCVVGDPQIADNRISCTYTLQGKEIILEAYGKKDRYFIEELSTDKMIVSYIYYGKNSRNEDIEIHVIYTMIKVNKYL